MRTLRRFILPAFVLGVLLGTSIRCAHVNKLADDIKACFGPDVKQDTGDLVSAIGNALVCDIESGGNAIPVCTTEALATIAEEIGPSGNADVKCVVEKLATDAASAKPGASPQDVVKYERAKMLKAKWPKRLSSNSWSTRWRFAAASPPGGGPGVVGGGGA
jgi:hypothetical protein